MNLETAWDEGQIFLWPFWGMCLSGSILLLLGCFLLFCFIWVFFIYLFFPKFFQMQLLLKVLLSQTSYCFFFSKIWIFHFIPLFEIFYLETLVNMQLLVTWYLPQLLPLISLVFIILKLLYDLKVKEVNFFVPIKFDWQLNWQMRVLERWLYCKFIAGCAVLEGGV